MARERSDSKSVIFKKLEKVGEPILYGLRLTQRYKVSTPVEMPKDPSAPCISYNFIDNLLYIEIKQTKEDMEEKKEITLDEMIKKCEELEFNSYSKQVKDWLIELKQCKEEKHSNSENIGKSWKPFNLETAKAGKPVITRDGHKVRIICFDKKGGTPIVGLIQEDGFETVATFNESGLCLINGAYNLMMLPEKKEGWVNVYKGGLLDTKSYNTKKEAFAKSSLSDYVATVKIEWEE